MSIKDKFIEAKPAGIAKKAVDNAENDATDSLSSADNAVGEGLGSAINEVGNSLDSVSEVADTAKDSMPDEVANAVDKLEDSAKEQSKGLLAIIEEKVVEIIVELGASPEDAEKVVALAKEHFPSEEASDAISGVTKKLLG